MAKTCAVDHCDQPIHFRRAGLCKNCYQRMYYWEKRSITERMQRRRRLLVWGSSLAAMDPSVTLAPMRKGRRRRSA